MNRTVFLSGLCMIMLPFLSSAQEFSITANTSEITLTPGKTYQIEASLIGSDGKPIKEAELYFYAANGRFADVDDQGLVTAYQPGSARVIVVGRIPDVSGRTRIDIPVTVSHAEISKIEIQNLPAEIYEGQRVSLMTRIVDENGFEMDIRPIFSTKDKNIATVDTFGKVKGQKKGSTEILASAGEITTAVPLTIRPNPVKKLEIIGEAIEARTGDVIQFATAGYDVKGNKVPFIVPVYAYTGVSEDPSEYASGMISEDGRFVADVAGQYTISSTFAGMTAQKTIEIVPREVTEKVQLMGHGAVSNVHTSDLWVWEGVDGRDYCVTGTWGGNGEAYFWDVTDPSSMVLVDTITVDARTVNDVKVSEDGRICIISREGASNRKNGIVIIDVTNPKDARIISTFTEGLTGGVHNLFIYKDHVYALSNGERYDIINIEDPINPVKVGEFEVDGPGHSIHDVWIEDGIAYSSNWAYGIYMVDVGNGVAGGSPAKPVVIGTYAYPSGRNHAAFPYTDKKTGKFYVIAGDEAFPNGLHVDDNPTIPAGFLHFIDFTDRNNPVEVAKYEVPGAGSHNFWVEGDLLYVANYNAGLRVVDLSGDLMGDLFKQGREIAWFLPTDPKGRVPNAPMTWGSQPHKGHVFFTDWNSGLWSVKVNVKKPENIKVDAR